MADQIKKLEKGVDVLIATPGRLMDLFGRGKIMLNGCNLLVIDEADRMLDMGFIPDIEEICTKLPTNRQTLLFSATMPAPIKKLADKFLTNPKTIEVSRPASSNLLIDQRVLRVDGRKKKEALVCLLKGVEVTNAIIFSNRKTTVRELAQSLQRSGFRAGQIHGDMEQPERIKELDRFKAGEINILVASDVAARGLDIKGVSHVFNYDVPWQPDDYIHRIGRTGRAGATGIAITLVASADADAVASIEKLIGSKIQPLDGAPEPEAAEAPAEKQAEKPARKPRERKPKAEPAERRQPKAESIEPTERTESRPRRERSEERGPRREAAPRPEPEEASQLEDADAEWNGPVPSFLAQGFGS
jgi:superfamily II DNA/RNA helicase